MSDLLNSALDFATRGWHVFPLLPRAKKPFKGSRGWKDATVNPRRIGHWWKQTPYANIGIATGEVSGFFVIDIDTRHGGHRALATLEEKYGPLPVTLKARTGGGGLHLLFRWPGWRVRSNNAGKVGPGIDVKGDGGYIVAAPSIHETGGLYEWESEPTPAAIAAAPDWLLTIIASRGGTESAEETSFFSVLSVPTVDDAIRLTLPTDGGQRHRRLFALARALKAIPEYANAEPSAIRPIVKRWFKAALPFIRTKDFDSTWADFVAAWPSVKWAIGTGPMTEVVNAAKAAKLPKCAKRYDLQPVQLLVALCRELQRRAKDGPIFLSARTAGDAIGISKSNAGRFLTMLVADKVLRIVEPGTKVKATRYRYEGG